MAPLNLLAERDIGFDVNYRGTQLFIVQLVFFVLSWIFIGLRFYVKSFLIRKTTLDDWLMYAAALLYTAFVVIDLYGIYNGGTGKHTDELTPVGASIALRTWYLCEVINVPLGALVRSSVSFLLLRIANERAHKIIIYINLAIIWTLAVVYFFICVFQCYPPSYFWEQVLGAQGSCIDQNVMPTSSIVQSILSALSDFVLALLPVAMLWKVRLNKRTKTTVALLLSLGCLAGIAMIVRIPFIKFLTISKDFLYQTVDVAIWSVMEPSVGIVAGCAATLRPLFKTWGFGPHTEARYGSKPSMPASITAGWKASRGIHKLDDTPTVTTATATSATRKPASNDHDSRSHTDSDIELSSDIQATGKTSWLGNGQRAAIEDDIEQGHERPQRRQQDFSLELRSPVVRVDTEIDISSRHLDETDSDESSTNNRALPLQGTRTVAVSGHRQY